MGFIPTLFLKGLRYTGVFYVGWRQTSETFLNAGYDVNTPNAGRQFYWLNGNGVSRRYLEVL